MKPILYIASLLSLMYLLQGCAPMQAFSDYDKSQDYTKYKTFAWLPRADSVHNYWYDNPIIEKNVKYFGNKELTDRGYAVDVNSPDLLIEYYSTVKNQQYTVSNPVYTNNPYYYNAAYNTYNGRRGYNPAMAYGYNNTPYTLSYQNQTVTYEEGTLLIDIIDRRQNRLIWRGWSVGTVDDEQDLENQLQLDIHKIFKQLPVKPTLAKK